MIKAYCVNKYLSGSAVRKIADTADKYGYNMTFCDASETDPGDRRYL